MLSELGVLWCLRYGCVVARTEIELCGFGIADAVGFGIKNGKQHGILIESKVSRSDFLRDRKKRHRLRDTDGSFGISDRYYIAPAGLLKPDEIPAPWGLLEWSDGQPYPEIVKRATYTAPDPRWWAHLMMCTVRGMTAHYYARMQKWDGYLPKFTIDGLPDALAEALAPLRHTNTSIHGNHQESWPLLKEEAGE